MRIDKGMALPPFCVCVGVLFLFYFTAKKKGRGERGEEKTGKNVLL